MQRIIFKQGETKHVRLLVHATNHEPFIIRSARYELMLADELEAEGSCIIDEHQIDCLITPKQKRRTYELKIIYEIADEILIEAICISVM